MKMTKEETCSLGSSFAWFSDRGNANTNVLSLASSSSGYFLGNSWDFWELFEELLDLSGELLGNFDF